MLAPKYLGNVGKYPATKNTEGKKVENKPLTTQEKRRCTAILIHPFSKRCCFVE
ncbi:hypothetical protein [Clostridium botulinum]